MSISNQYNALVTVNNFCDYVPVLSTASNLVDLFQKYIVFPFVDTNTLQQSRYYTHVMEKSSLRCILLLFPVIGNVFVFLWDISRIKNKNDVNDICEAPKEVSS